MNIKKINILKPQILFLVFVYSMSFALLLIGLKLFNLETNRLSDARQNGNILGLLAVPAKHRLVPRHYALNSVQIEMQVEAFVTH